MKKTTKTLAAMLAAVMTVSALGSMSAFAITDVTSNHYTDGGSSQSATVDLQAKVTDGDTTETDGSFNTNVDTDKHIWNVMISADTLTWDLVKNTTTTYYRTLTWDAANHVYVAARATGDNSVESTAAEYEVASTDYATKTVNVQNDSNFVITSATSIIAKEETAKGATFTAEDPQSSIGIGETADTTITINTSGMANQGFDSTEYVSVGTATITLTAVDNTIAEYTPVPSGD